MAQARGKQVFSLSGTKTETAIIREILKGETALYGRIIEKYQPMVYAIALAQTGNVFLADKVVVETFEECYERLISLTDVRKLGVMLVSIAQQTAEQLSSRRAPNWNKPRQRNGESVAVDLKWVQNELIEPLEEELGSFTPQERKGILLHAFFGASSTRIADLLKITRKEAAEDLSRTRENIEKALLKEVTKALKPEINNKERLLHIMTTLGGAEVAAKAGREIHKGKSPIKIMPMLVASIAIVVLCISIYFASILFKRLQGEEQPSPAVTAQKPANEGDALDTAPKSSLETPANYTLQGRVVDERFLTDGVTGLIVEAGGKTAETDFYGAFEIPGVARGQHDVTVRTAQRILARGIRLNTEGRNNPIPIAVNEDIPARFIFQGRVFDRVSGQAVERFEVASCKDFPEMMQPYLLEQFKAQSHPNGLLKDRYLILGNYTIYVRARGYAPLPVRFTIDENWTGQQVYEFPLYRASRFMGTVYGANELSVGGVSIIPRQGTAYGVLQESIDYGRTNSMGRFELYTLPVGIQSFLFTHMEQVARAIVELEPGKTTNVKIQFPRRGSLTGDITLQRRPVKFKEFCRNVGGSYVDLSKNIRYLSPGQYEIVLTPEPVTILAGVEPAVSDRWFIRRLEQETNVSMTECTWLDFNFQDGPGTIQGNIALPGNGMRFLFVEVTYIGEKSRERLYYDLGSSTAFQLQNLPLGKGEVTVYASGRSVGKQEFNEARIFMEKQSKPFAMENDQRFAQVGFSL